MSSVFQEGQEQMTRGMQRRAMKENIKSLIAEKLNRRQIVTGFEHDVDDFAAEVVDVSADAATEYVLTRDEAKWSAPDFEPENDGFKSVSTAEEEDQGKFDEEETAGSQPDADAAQPEAAAEPEDEETREETRKAEILSYLEWLVNGKNIYGIKTAAPIVVHQCVDPVMEAIMSSPCTDQTFAHVLEVSYVSGAAIPQGNKFLDCVAFALEKCIYEDPEKRLQVMSSSEKNKEKIIRALQDKQGELGFRLDRMSAFETLRTWFTEGIFALSSGECVVAPFASASVCLLTYLQEWRWTSSGATRVYVPKLVRAAINALAEQNFEGGKCQM